MTPEREQEIERICQAALDRPRGERETFLVAACRGDEDLRGEVERLLSHESAASAFLATPALVVATHDMGDSSHALRAGQQLGSSRSCRRWDRAAWARSIAPATRHWAERSRSRSYLGFASDPERLARFEREARCWRRSTIPTSAPSMASSVWTRRRAQYKLLRRAQGMRGSMRWCSKWLRARRSTSIP